MPDPITFTTEAERLKAREQYVRTCHAADIANESMRIGDWYYESRFDTTFPPIAPPKMVPEEWWVFIRPDGKREGPFFDRTSKPTANPGAGYRITRVRVVEVDE